MPRSMKVLQFIYSTKCKDICNNECIESAIIFEICIYKYVKFVISLKSRLLFNEFYCFCTIDLDTFQVPKVPFW